MTYKKYNLIKTEHIPDLDAEAMYLKHSKTKAKILLLKNKNINKTFSIGFKTPPNNSTGVAHIVEHSTLSGSRKYKTKEPFMDMISSSMQTFLNAMTYPDKTIYPISSRNLKDFQQLMDLYLDSVFYPRMYDVKEIFLQEGWHEEIQEGKLIYNGVVYNEMKGVYSDPSNQVSDIVREILHPSGTYHHDSGGNPKFIPDLSYQEFLDFHSSYYHPSNSYILLAGDLDFQERLEYLDREYLQHFDYLQTPSEIISHETYKNPLEFFKTYSTSKEEYSEDKTYLAMSWNIKNNPQPLDLLLRNFFAELLIESDNALLKTKLLEKGIGEDIYSELFTGNSLDFTLFAYHTNKNKYEEFQTIVMSELKNLVEKGIPKKDLESTLNKFEFSIRQGGGSHRDLISYIGALNTWLYGQDPIEALKIGSLLEYMREKIPTDFYENKIKEWFIDSNNRIQGYIEPEIGKQEKEDSILAEKLSQRLLSLNETEKEKIIQQQEQLVEFQMREDLKEAKDTIPKLEISDIPKDITEIEREYIQLSNVEGTFNKQTTNGIVYGTFAFPLSHLNLEEMVDASILADLLGRLATESYSREELSQEVFLRTGGISFETPVELHANNQEFTPYLFIRLGMLEDKLEKGLSILNEILFNTNFSNEKHILEILYSMKSDMEASILQSAHTLSMARLKSYFHKASYVDEEINGLELYFKVSDLLKNFKYEEFVKRIKLIYKKIFYKDLLKFNITGEINSLDKAKHVFSNFISQLQEDHENILSPKNIPFEPQRKNEAFVSSSMVNYVAKGYNINLLGESYSGQMAVLANILSTKYLHYNIRAKGGAYGAGIQFSRSNLASTYSYRDPNLENTIEVYNKIGDYVENLQLSQRELDDFIIGTMNSFDPHLPPHSLGLLDFKRYLNGVTKEKVMEWKEEALKTNLASLKEKSSLLKEIMKQDYLCVIGNEEEIQKNKEKFTSIRNLKQ